MEVLHPVPPLALEWLGDTPASSLPRSILRSNGATRLDFVKSPKTGKMFFALDNSASTKGAISKSLQEEIASGKSLAISEVVVADTVMEGETSHCWLLMKVGESNRIGGFSL